MRIRSFVAWVRTDRSSVDAPPIAAGWFQRRWGGLTIRFVPRSPAADEPTDDVLLLNEDAEFDPVAPDRALASGVPIRFDAATNQLILHTSIVALPPIFVLESAGCIALASDLVALKTVPGVRLEFDPIGIAQLGRIGHPVGHRTLFQNVTLASGGQRIELSTSGSLRQSRAWELPAPSPLSWPAFLEAQSAAFLDAVRRLDVSQSFLSLTAGLDTRTVLSALAADGRLPPSATMTGVTPSLDAMTAQRLCAAYGVPHTPVVIGDSFLRDLPRGIETANRLSGGLKSLNQATELHMYAVMGDSYRGRVSGDLGNQVGRGGTEGVSLRGADLSILAPEHRNASPDDGHWLLAGLEKDERSSLQFILQHEVPFSSVAIFSIGSHFTRQQTPYSNRKLIETLSHRPEIRASPYRSRFAMRVRDLRHRFLGEPAEHSFQRTLVTGIGGFAADYPVNWGWRARGGVSPLGLVRGGLTLGGMAARARGLDDGVMARRLGVTRLAELHDFRDTRRWLRERLADYVQDTLRTREFRTSGWMNGDTLDRMLSQHFAGQQDHFESITYALDVALAYRHFCRP